MYDSFLKHSIPSATKHLFILAKIHLLFYWKLLSHARSLSSSLNLQSTHSPLVQSHPTLLTFPSHAKATYIPIAIAISTVSLLAFSFLLIGCSTSIHSLAPSFKLLDILLLKHIHMSPQDPTFHFPHDSQHQFLYSPFLPQPLSVSSAPW